MALVKAGRSRCCGPPARCLRLFLFLSFCLATGAASARASPANPALLLEWRSEAQAYEHGEGVPRDLARALSLYCNGARHGDAEAQYSLGWIYANGRGVGRDDAVAAHFFALAARQGHVQAQNMLRHVGNPPARAPQCLRQLEAEAGEAPGGASPAVPRQHRKIADLVNRLAPQYGVYPRLALAVISVESNFDPVAMSPRNAQGVMQLIPETSARFKVARPFDPEQNIRGGLAYLRWLLAYFQGNVALVAAAYNAGEGAVNRYRGVPPFAETRDYVRRIKAIFRQDEHPYDPKVTPPSPELSRIRATG